MIESPLETDIFNYKTPEFFINMKDIPDKNSRERKAFVLEEKRKVREGLNINGVRIPGGLYFHLNYYKLSKDVQGSKDKKEISLPTLRDNEWIVFNDYDSLENNPKIYTLFGARQLLKTEFETSMCLRELSVFKNTEALALFQADIDKDTFVKKMRIAITHGEKFIIVPNIDQSWDKSEIRFGITKQDNTIDLRGTLYIYNTQEGKKIQVGSGKALRHGSKVYYEDKIGNIENCQVGDKIYGRNGQLTTILGVYPQGIVDLYEIELFDGRKITCSGDHLWTLNRTDKIKNRKETITTEELFSNYKRKYFNKKLNKEILVNRYTIPNIEPINYDKKDVAISPYYLGLWLGDGTTKNPSNVTTVETEVIDFLEQYSKELGGRLTKKDNITYRISHLQDEKHSPLIPYFQKYKLKGNKHIPKDYLFNSTKVRLEVLRGLMDTDGYVDKNGKISLSLSNQVLANDAIQLIRSLGINCTVTQKETSYFSKKYNKRIEGKIATVIYIGSSDLELFKVKKKLDRQVFKKRPDIGVENIRKVKPDYATCIKVDNEDSLFLTNDFIPTHNTATFLIFDECAKSKFRAVYDTIEPALLTDFGTLRCVPLFTFTGGEVEKAIDAENMVRYPQESKQFTTILEDNKLIGGRFLNGYYRKDFKKPSTVSEYIGKKTGTWLDDYPIMVSDFELAKQSLAKEFEEASKSPDPRTSLLKRIFSPITLDDVFLSQALNNFPVEAARAHQYKLREELPGECVEFYRDEKNAVQWKFSSLKPINKYPVKHEDNKEAPVVILEHPLDYNQRGVYVMGVDSYNKNESSDKINSLGSIYIIKRTCDPLGNHQHSIVAYYAGRPDDIVKFYHIALNMAEYYDAIVLPELNERFSDFFVNKKKGFYIQNAIQLARDINSDTFFRGSEKGLTPTTRNQKYGMELAVNYTIEEVADENNNIVLGITRIPDPMLLEEMIQYKAKPSASKGIHDINCDRIVAFYHALILAEHLDKYMPVSHMKIKKQDGEIKKKPIELDGFFGKIGIKPRSFQSNTKPTKPKGVNFL